MLRLCFRCVVNSWLGNVGDILGFMGISKSHPGILMLSLADRSSKATQPKARVFNPGWDGQGWYYRGGTKGKRIPAGKLVGSGEMRLWSGAGLSPPALRASTSR